MARPGQLAAVDRQPRVARDEPGADVRAAADRVVTGRVGSGVRAAGRDVEQRGLYYDELETGVRGQPGWLRAVIRVVVPLSNRGTEPVGVSVLGIS